MKIFDSHAHYDDCRFSSDLEKVLAAAQAAGVERIMNAGCCLRSSRESVRLCENNDLFCCSVGIHPGEADTAHDDWLCELRQLAESPHVKAIGEIGLDYHYDGHDKGLQRKIFLEQLDLAAQLELPVVVHSRDASEDTVRILSEFGGTGVLHCFSGSAETARQMLEFGFFLGFTGTVTFPNARRVRDVVSITPLDRLLVETDCPYLSPVPHRGKRCDSSMLTHVIEKIAEIKEISAEEVAKASFENAQQLFSMRK